MPPSKTNTRSHRAAAKRLAIVAVCLIAPIKPKIRFYGDNRGGLPAKIKVTKGKPEDAAKDQDQHDPYDEWATLEFVYVPSEEHGNRLKAALDGCLLGEQSQLGNEAPRRSFRDLLGCFEDEQMRAMWWGIILDAALRDVKTQATQFDVFDDDEKQRRIAASARRGR